MPTINFVPVEGVVQSITPTPDNCCEQVVAIRNADGISNFVVAPDTYVINEVRLRPGMNVIAYYDANLPIPLIFPPRYQTVVIGRKNPGENMFVGYFGSDQTSLDNTLQLNIARSTEIVTSNGQAFNCSINDQLLVVYYTTSTRSIPAQTTPRKIIVLC